MSKSNFYCDSCHITLTGYAPYTMHMAGKKHLKKLKSKAAESAQQKDSQGQPDSTVADSSGRKMAEGYGGKFVSASSNGQSASSNGQTVSSSSQAVSSSGQAVSSSGQGTTPKPSINKTPVKSNTGTNYAVKSNTGPKYPVKSNTGTNYPVKSNMGTSRFGNYGYGNQNRGGGGGYVTYPNVTYTDFATGQPWINPAPPLMGSPDNGDPVMRAVRDNLLGKIPKKRAITEQCDLCKIEYSSQIHKEQHIAGKKHLKKAEKAEAKKHTYFCDYCKKELNSPEQMDQHRAGALHHKKLKAHLEAQKQLRLQGEGPTPPKRIFIPTTTQIAVSSV